MRLLATLAVLFVGVASATANPVTVEVRNRPPDLVVSDGKVSGPVYQLIEAVMLRAGYHAEYVVVPWKRSLLLARKGKAGVLVRHSMNEKRAAFLHSMPYGYERRKVMFIRKKDSAANPASFEELKPYLIGQRASAYYYPEFNNSTNLQKLEATGEQTLIRMLHAGRLDLVVSDDQALFRENAEAVGLPYDEHFEPAAYQVVFLNGRFFSVPKSGHHARYFADLNCALYELRTSGKVDEIFKAAGVTAPIQSFDEPSSITQQNACAG
ncbi:polar amino acid transport system substrate-binding protein [Roseibium hamelinense]|uniref:Polar amino acid transport system substrate-binding protein n=1 Tax=Roseibium hamelinense TaxID=150831 RepID=A0A562TJB3_9HYPH|nr:ABC transporter substrate-binding protein [Roseibium hamelinense]MTI46009.1 ABC transporter substrate-binding protein [Roseibium hamelinense]TWI92800.1 polar amino acid transport system substrate-binding protein [Roseibium hamelinense]